MRTSLSKSLSYILGEIAGHVDTEPLSVARALSTIQSHSVSPGVFARYYDLVFAISNNRFAEAQQLTHNIISMALQPASFEIRPLSNEQLGDDFARYHRLLFAESPNVGTQMPPGDGQFAAASRNLNEAIAIIQDVEPRIAREIQGLWTRIYLSRDKAQNGRASFGGVTSFMIWGATFMNADGYQDRWDMVQFLVHEITHALLFGLAARETLVLNAASDGYPSPLRTELRPMDGVYHAAIVCARLADFNQRWLDSSILNEQERERSIIAVNDNGAAFRDGAATISEHGILSQSGRELFANCCDGLDK